MDRTLDGEVGLVFLGARHAVIDKPAGLLSVPGKGPEKQDCALGRLRAFLTREGIPASGPMVVHRLDMDTSGLMVFALDPEAQRNLSAQFEAREVGKRYAALVEGIVARDWGVIDAPIRLEPRARPFRVVDQALGQPARTRWRVVSREVDRTRIEFEPETGRTHQIRVHAAWPAPLGLGHPIVGDVLYGGEGQSVFRALLDQAFTTETRRNGEESGGGRGQAQTHAAPERLMLHAAWLRFREPGGNAWVEYESRPGF